MHKEMIGEIGTFVKTYFRDSFSPETRKDQKNQ